MLDYIGLISLTLILAYMMISGIIVRSQMLQFPFLYSVVMIGWFLPQAYLLVGRPDLPDLGFAITMGYVLFCSLGVLAADRIKVEPKLNSLEEFEEKKLLIGAIILSGIGYYAYSAYLNTNAEHTAEGLTTGIVTIYFFLFQLQYFGFAFSFIILLKWKSPLALALVIFNLFTIGGFIAYGGRRGPLVEVALIILTLLWFQRRFALPRTAIIAGTLVAAVFVSSAGEYRQTVQRVNSNVRYNDVEARLPTFDEILNINFLDRFLEYDDRRTDEVRNAIYDISFITSDLNFSFGARYWNYLVFRYVPGQIVGHEIKNSIQFPVEDVHAGKSGYRKHLGTTSTGFSDTYGAFFIFGSLVFFLIAWFMKWLWVTACRGDIKSQYFYCILIGTALMSVTHGTLWFVAALPQAFLFSLIVFAFSKKVAKRRSVRFARH